MNVWRVVPGTQKESVGTSWSLDCLPIVAPEESIITREFSIEPGEGGGG